MSSRLKLNSSAGGSVSITAPDGLTTDEVYTLTNVAGIMFDFGGGTAPAGSLPCTGQEVSKTAYPELYAAIGDLWATTGGASAPSAGNFRLPPQQVGGLGLYHRGAYGGVVVGTYQADVFKEHDHDIKGGVKTQAGTTPDGDGFIAVTGSTENGGVSREAGGAYTTIINSGDPTETRPRSITVLKCIWTGR